MRTASLALTLLVLPNASASLLAFASPFQFDGNGEWDGLRSVTIVSPPGGTGLWDVLMPAGTVLSNLTQIAYEFHNDALEVDYSDRITRGRNDSVPGTEIDASATLLNGWAAVTIHAEKIFLAMDGHQVTTVRNGAFDLQHYAAAPFPPGTTHPDVSGSDGNLVLAGAPYPGRPSIRVELQATSVNAIEWHNVTFSCRSNRCPPAAPVIRGIENGGVTMETWYYGSAQGRGGSVHGWTDAIAVLATGSRLSADLNGTSRFPAAQCNTDCAGPLSGASGVQTLALDGSTRVTHLSRQDSDHLTTDASGSWRNVRLDEWDVPAIIKDAGLGVATGALGILVLWKSISSGLKRVGGSFLFGYNRADPLGHPVRVRILETVSHCTMTRADLVRKLGVSRPSVSFHLSILKRHGLVQTVTEARKEHYHVPGLSDPPKQALLANPIRAHIMDCLGSGTGLAARDLLSSWGNNRPSWGQLMHHARVLQAAGLVVFSKQGRSTRISRAGA